PGRWVGRVVDRHDLDLPAEQAAARVHLGRGELRTVQHADADALLIARERRFETDADGTARLCCTGSGSDGQAPAHHGQRDQSRDALLRLHELPIVVPDPALPPMPATGAESTSA